MTKSVKRCKYSCDCAPCLNVIRTFDVLGADRAERNRGIVSELTIVTRKMYQLL